MAECKNIQAGQSGVGGVDMVYNLLGAKLNNHRVLKKSNCSNNTKISI